MKITKINKDYFVIDEKFFYDSINLPKKVHLIKLNFIEPTIDMIQDTINIFKNTNRFIVENDKYLYMYNNFFKKIMKKYYVENVIGNGLISFFKKNNKVLLNIDNLLEDERTFVLNNIGDVIKNLEVINFNRREKEFESIRGYLMKNFKGNIIVGD